MTYLRIRTAILLLTAIGLALTSTASAGIKIQKPHNPIDVAGYVDAISHASITCSSATNCFYKFEGGATACALLGGEVEYFSSAVNGRFTLTPGDCNTKTSSKTDKFNTNCHTVTANLIGPFPDSSSATECVPPSLVIGGSSL